VDHSHCDGVTMNPDPEKNHTQLRHCIHDTGCQHPSPPPCSPNRRNGPSQESVDQHNSC